MNDKDQNYQYWLDKDDDHAHGITKSSTHQILPEQKMKTSYGGFYFWLFLFALILGILITGVVLFTR